MESVQAPLLVSTGLVGDTVREVPPGHRTYARLARCLGEQDEWDHRAHAAFWTALLPELPPRGRCGRLSRVDLLSRAASALRADGLTRAEVENVLSVASGTVRAREPETAGRSRPSYERGDRLRREAQGGSHGEALGRMTGAMWVPWEAYPRVWDDPDDEPQDGHFNLLIAADDWQPPGLESALAAEEELRRRWYRRRGRDASGPNVPDAPEEAKKPEPPSPAGRHRPRRSRDTVGTR